MSIPTNEEILQLLDRLDETIADDLESEFLDFKPWHDSKRELRIAVEYAGCFANAEGGVVVFGVADKTRGRADAIQGVKGYDLDTWQRGIFDATRPNLSVRVEELPVPEGTLLLVRVPKGSDPPYGTAKGLYQRRVGKNCMPLDPRSFARTQITAGTVDWSGLPARGVSRADLDPVEIARARNLLSDMKPEPDLLELDETAFLQALGAIRGNQVTHAGLLLFGRESLLTELCPQHQIHYVYQTSETEVARNDSYRCGLLHALERIDAVFSGPVNPEKEVLVGLYMLRIPAYPPTVVREAWLNAVTHRDYSDPGEVLIRHTDREVVVVSPGGFLADITPQNILKHEAIHRNRTLAEAFQKLRLVERAGVGRRRIFLPMLEYGKRIPVYETDGARVVLKLFNGSPDTRLATLVARWKKAGRGLGMDALLVLSYLRHRASIDVQIACALLQVEDPGAAQAILDDLAQPEKGFLERRGEPEAASYRLVSSVAKEFLDDHPKYPHAEPRNFTRRVAELFQLLGYKTLVDYKRDDLQFDIRMETKTGPLSFVCLVECKHSGRPVGQREVREFSSKVEYARRADACNYKAILVSSSGFVGNAHSIAAQMGVELLTWEELMLSLVDFGPNLEAAIQGFEGTLLERLYIEQAAVFQSAIRTGAEVEARPLTEAVREWIDQSPGTFLTILGDLGTGKTSFCRRLACELARNAREQSDGCRIPILIDLREAASSVVTLENLIVYHFQRLSASAVNPQALLRLNHEGYLVMLFDGFDETMGFSEPGRYLENLRQILRAAEGRAKVIMTCRTHYFRDRPEEVRWLGRAAEVLSTEGATRLYEEIRERPGTEICYLREFDDGQIAEYLRKVLPPQADWRSFREQIRRTYNLEDLAERPFLLELIVKTLPRLQDATGRGEVTLADLYESYCAGWFEKSDFRLTLTREHKVALVEYLARLLWDVPEQKEHHQALFEKAAEFFNDQELTPYDKERLDYEVRTTLFLNRDADGYYRFSHRSCLEFSVARTLRTGLKLGESRCLDLRHLAREVAFFLEFWPEAATIPEFVAEILERPYRERVSENALMLLYFHCRAQVGPLVGPGSEISLLAEEIARFSAVFRDLRPERLDLRGADLSGVELCGADLGRSRLGSAKLDRADLRGTSLAGADLEEASLTAADFRQASFADARLTRAILDHGDGREADFRGADLTGANLAFGQFARADFTNARMEGIETAGADFTDARGIHQ